MPVSGARTTLDHTIVYSETVLGYLLIEIDGPAARFSLQGLDGERLDGFGYGDAALPECNQDVDCNGVPAPEFACPGGGYICRSRACAWRCDDLNLLDLPLCIPAVTDCASELGAG